MQLFKNCGYVRVVSSLCICVHNFRANKDLVLKVQEKLFPDNPISPPKLGTSARKQDFKTPYSSKPRIIADKFLLESS